MCLIGEHGGVGLKKKERKKRKKKEEKRKKEKTSKKIYHWLWSGSEEDKKGPFVVELSKVGMGKYP